jgi:ATP-binding cassette subfamily C protein/ATP-binding cassette subfamily C protein LapB
MLPISIRDFIADNRNISDEEMRLAFEKLDALAWLNCLEAGLDTRLDEIESLSHPLSNFEANILTQAKLYCQAYPFVLLDSPVSTSQDKPRFMRWVESQKGKSTILFTSHDLDLIKIADHVIVLDHGSVSYAGPLADENKAEIPEEAQ